MRIEIEVEVEVEVEAEAEVSGSVDTCFSACDWLSQLEDSSELAIDFVTRHHLHSRCQSISAEQIFGCDRAKGQLVS